MAKKSKGDDRATPTGAGASAGGEGYAFPMPNFDEKAFMRRELESAKTTFWTAGAGLVVGALAWVLGRVGGDWRLGWLPVVVGLLALAPGLKKLGFSDESTAPKAMFGNWFLLFFTALSVWIVAVNLF